MELTVAYLKKQFDKYNKEFFDDALPDITIEISRTKKVFGTFQYYTATKEPIKITISKYYDRSEKDICSTLIHEMIHYYICFMGFKDTNSHGVIFTKIAKNISVKSGILITATTSSDGYSIRQKNKKYKIMIFTYQGKTRYARICENFDYNYFIKRYKLENVSIFYCTNKEFDNWTLCKSRLRFYNESNINFNIKKVAA